MSKIIDFDEIKSNFFKKKSIIVIGFFDGVHKGHTDIINKCIKRSMETGLKSIALTFDKPPLNIITGKKEKKLIISFEKKLNMIKDLGIDYVVTVNFDDYFANLTPYQFCKEVLEDKLNVAEIFVGENFRFGKNAQGDTKFLTEYFKNTDVRINVVDLFKINSVTVSSTEIRKFYEKGDVEKINLFMGRYPSISGKVVKGFERGGRIGFPTANIELDENYIIPKKGVYFARIKIQGYKKSFPCIVNIGDNPTFGLKRLLLEAHIIGFDNDIYERLIDVELIKFHRDEIKFPEENSLINQIKSDIREGMIFFKFND